MVSKTNLFISNRLKVDKRVINKFLVSYFDMNTKY